MMKVNEIFYSLQGEGYHAGTAAVFVRLSGCNLHCPFCDTQHESGTEMTDEEIVEAVKPYPARLVVITGGEPSLQLTKSLVNALHDIDKMVADAKKLNPKVHVITSNLKDGEGLDEIIKVIEDKKNSL